MSHFYLPPSAWASESALSLTGDEARHCAQVRRQRVGDAISVLDGQGRRAECVIVSISKHTVELQVSSIEEQSPPAQAITLLQAVPKASGMEWIIEKAVELGVTEILPLVSARTVSRIEPKEADKKVEKWQRCALEACKQCGQVWLPVVRPPTSVEAAIQQCGSLPCRLVASLESGTRPVHEIVKQSTTHAALAIGPEGDFTPEEYAAFAKAGWLPLTLGTLTLRCETAAIAGTAVLKHHLSTL
jgi:16S rRNA (uracil1498-N3)-methyltransferase